MPLTLLPDEAAAFASGLAPPAHLDLLHAVSFRSAAAASRLGLFAVLADGPLTAADAAAAAGTDPHATELLLRTLTTFEHLAVETGADGARRFVLTPGARATLLPGPSSYALVLEFWATMLDQVWTSLEASVRTGRPAVDFYGWLEAHPSTLAQFQTMLARLAGMLGPEVVAATTVPAGPSRLLDVGGAHARYTLAFCAAHPELSATVLDLPGALDNGRAAVAAAGLDDRVELRAWDIARPTPVDGGPYDVALLLNVVHGFQPAENVALLRAVAEAMAPGGTVVVLEPLDDDGSGGSPTGEAFVRLFSLNLFHGQGGRTYALGEITAWLEEAGFTDVRTQGLAASGSDHLVLATRR